MKNENDRGTPLVSVAIITYQQRDLLRECVNSVLAQDYPNIEICVSDDGSKDGTHEMLEEFRANHPDCFKLKLSTKNFGITPNSNAAQELCSGKYIAWMGGDDLWHENKISRQVEFMESQPECRLSYHNAEIFAHETGQKIRLFNGPSQPSRFPRVGGVEQFIRYPTAFNNSSSTMVRAEFAKPFDETIKIPSDYLYWMEILADGGTVCYLDEVLTRYRRHANNVTTTTNILQRYSDRIRIFKILGTRYPQLRQKYRKTMLFHSANYRLKYLFRKYVPGFSK